MKKLYATLLTALCISVTYAQDTLKHYNLEDLVESPLEQNAFPTPWGYSYGHGAKGHYEFAEKYYVSKEMQVLGVVVYLDDIYGGATSDQEDWVALYKKNGTDPDPADEPFAKATVVAKDLEFGLYNPTIVMFSNEVLVKDSFFAAFGFPKYPFNTSSPGFKYPQDSIGLLITGDRTYDSDPNISFRNAIRFNGGFWADPTGIEKGDDPRNFLISPIVSEPDTTTGMEEHTLLTNKAITVKSVYPNPVANSATFSLELTQTSHVRVSLMDMSGKNIKTFNYGEVQSGERTVLMDMSSIETGQYIYVIQSDHGVIASVLNKI